MSGHSKWSQIKRDKGANDTKRGAVFAKLSKKISVTVREGGSGEPNHNFKLRLAIEKAKAISMPNDNIERAIKKGLGTDEGTSIAPVIYEAYGPAGVALIIEGATDNKNRTVQNVKKILTKYGGSFGAQGSVSWQFITLGEILISRHDNSNLQKLELTAIDAGVEDVQESMDGLAIYTQPEKLELISSTLQNGGAIIASADTIMQSNQLVNLNDEQRNKAEILITALEDDEDITAVHTNIAN